MRNEIHPREEGMGFDFRGSGFPENVQILQVSSRGDFGDVYLYCTVRRN